MATYKCLSKQAYTQKQYSLLPIRNEDRYKIMQWRNEQIYHLRQIEKLTKEKQDEYFQNVITKHFVQEKPDQILFSFLEGDDCIGYGGLVHINWVDKNAEISFIMKTQLEEHYFIENWRRFLILIEQVAFKELAIHKIFTHAFDLRPKLYMALDIAGFKKEAILSEHCYFNGQFIDVVLHKKINREITLSEALRADEFMTFQWANNAIVRKYAVEQSEITEAKHNKWFTAKVDNPNCKYYIAMNNQVALGSFRLDLNLDGSAIISYLLDPKYHGKGYGIKLLEEGLKKAKSFKNIKSIFGYVKPENTASVHLFKKLDFKESRNEADLIKFEMKIK